MHAKQLAKLQKEGTTLSPAATPFGKDVKTSLATQDEGTHYRLLYSGSKLFWRTNETIDLDIYFHVIAHTIEIIAFDSVKSREWRLYLQYETVLNILEKTIKEALAAKEEAAHKLPHKFTVSKENNVSASMYVEVMLEEVRQTTITNYILNRIQLVASSPAAPNGGIEFQKLGGDDSKVTPLLPAPPQALIPIVVNRRRKTSAEEIEKTISGLQMDYAALKNATARAERISTLVFEGANMLTSLLTAKKSNASKWAKLWGWAIRRIIRQKHVKLMKQHLESLEAKRKAEELAANPPPSAVRGTVQKLRRSFDNSK